MGTEYCGAYDVVESRRRPCIGSDDRQKSETAELLELHVDLCIGGLSRGKQIVFRQLILQQQESRNFFFLPLANIFRVEGLK